MLNNIADKIIFMVLDRGDDTLEMYALMDQLREQALHAGGQVLSHLGNHEVCANMTHSAFDLILG
jgi:hypothetical protein